MLTLVTGGAGSGKSEYAEQLAVAAGDGARLYVATMQPSGACDPEFAARVARHRKLRAGKGFTTTECPRGLVRVEVPANAVVLLECLSNLAANELFAPNATERDANEAITAGVEHLCKTARQVIIVTNDLFADGISYDAGTDDYLRLLGALNRELGRRAERIVEVVYGIPVWHKGREVAI